MGVNLQIEAEEKPLNEQTRKRIRVAYVLTPVDFGGSEKVSLNFLNNVDRDRFDIHPIVLIRPWEDEGGNLFLQKLKKKNYAFTKIPVALRTKSKGRDYFRVLRCFKLIYRELRRGGYDIAHTHGYFADIIGIPASRLLGIPCVSTCHGFIQADRKLSFYNSVDIFMLRFASRTIAVSEEIKKSLLARGIRNRRIAVIQNAVDTDLESINEARVAHRKALGCSENEFVIGYVGRLSAEKGIKYLIEAFSLLKKELKNSRLLIVGDGPLKQELQELASRMSVSDRAVFAGFQKETRHWFAAFDAFALPSLSEGTPMALLEAMSYGLPAVASAVGGVPRVIRNGENGLLTGPRMPMELKDAIFSIYNNRELRHKISSSARKTVCSDYDIREWTRKMESQYSTLAKQGARS